MTLRKIALLAVAASGLFAAFPVQAEAKPFFLFRPFLPGYQDGYPPPDAIYYMNEEEYYQYLKRQRRQQRILEDYYANQDNGYDGQGYDDQYEPPRRIKKKIAKPDAVEKKAQPKAVAKSKTKPSGTAVANVSKKPGTAATAQANATGKTNLATKDVLTSSTSKPAGGGMSCTKAADIVTGYGFDSVKPGACSGSVYSFNASRSGKAYLIKVNAASGELTEVKKL